MQRHDGRAADQLRVLKIQRGFVRTAQASVLIEAGNTMVLCTASVERVCRRGVARGIRLLQCRVG